MTNDAPAFWNEHKSALRAYVARRISDSGAVDDILQDVFLKAHSGIIGLRSEERIAPWLFRIAGHRVVDHYRSARPTEELPDDVESKDADSGAIAELSSCLRPQIGSLPETYRDPIELSEIYGLPHKEVAHRLGLTLTAAKSRIRRGRELLRQRLVDCCHVEVGRGGVISVDAENRACDCESC